MTTKGFNAASLRKDILVKTDLVDNDENKSELDPQNHYVVNW